MMTEHDPTGALDRAISAFKAGNLAEAEKLCQEILSVRDDVSDALNILATVQQRLGKADAALATYDRLLSIQPDFTHAHFERGNVLQALKRYDEALVSYDRAIALRPDFARAHRRRGNILHRKERRDEALASYERAIQARPDFVRAHLDHGDVLQSLNRRDEAVASYDRALALQPDFAQAHVNRGNALQTLGWREEALASYDRAIGIQPNFAFAHYNRGTVLQELGRQHEALAAYDRTIALRPDLAEAISNRGNVLQALGRFEEAISCYDRAVDQRPDFPEAFSNRGTALQELRRYDEALASYDRAIALRPGYSDALCNRGIALRQLARFDDALESFAGAITASPQNAEAHFGEAEIRLLLGEFDRGWEIYEWRSRANWLRGTGPNFNQPRWNGEDEIAGKTLLLHAEQGFGDTIQFCRYVPLVADRGARVIFQVQEPLRKLMAGLDGPAQVVSMATAPPDFDVHCPLLGLPLMFKTRLDTIPATVPYLQVPPEAVAHWDGLLGPEHRPRIGLVWSGRPAHKNDLNRSIPLTALLPLLDVDATFVSLQKDVRPQDDAVLKALGDLLHFGGALKDFSDTAALVSNLDLIVAVDTSVAHLAGALAKPVWVLLPAVPDWRWLLGRDDSPWYPTMRLFRQGDTQAWDDVIARVQAALRDFVHRSS